MVPPLLLDRSCCSEDVAGGDTEEWGGGGGGTMGNTVLPAAAAAASALATAAATAARRALKNCNSAKFALLANLSSASPYSLLNRALAGQSGSLAGRDCKRFHGKIFISDPCGCRAEGGGGEKSTIRCSEPWLGLNEEIFDDLSL